jgi:hypothetical protein
MQNHDESVKRVIALVPEPEIETSFGMWEAMVKQNFPNLVFPAELALSIITQVLIQDISNPFALVLMGAPSSGKTTVTNFFTHIENITYVSDKFTPHAFVSGAANQKEENLNSIDMLPRIRHKMLIARDLAVIFSKREEELTELMGLLTRALDGEGLTIDTGTHGSRGYTGDYLFMLLGASTPIKPRIWRIMGGLGSRIFIYRMNGENKTEETLAGQLGGYDFKLKEKAVNKTTKDFLFTLWSKYSEGLDWKRENDPADLKLAISTMASLLARLRGVINFWSDDPNSQQSSGRYKEPNIESPDRINQLFYNLARGHALAQGRLQITEDDLRVVLEVAIDSPPTMRSKLFRKLLDMNGTMTRREIATAFDCTDTTVAKYVDELIDLGVCIQKPTLNDSVGRPEHCITLAERWKWFLGDQCKRIRGK